ncbi:hypothetical protein N7359_01880 [Stenotrophomonas maltophilia]|uniref:hypothetical protein n=1 Tax=Stenotrophomonas maltophilia TaxID=40324 RepID=UPI00244C643B|nr:hypothetical protein [Stenotrophomonas maltophilia]MDH0071291.1 hypothetical protein [Stenotrophomonas maltophilia]MDH0104112.1 hypothetical protein [Stenotrophomonas maltophilia]MDH0330239.1 hypothetical protein [Stenotrophomonas maltophilia]MDH0740912.1 hypothetical protein [Stenotrophomonas maltophilia]MDH1328348.1 hypothetical protein [Stenotrophomonas maltophilia]
MDIHQQGTRPLFDLFGVEVEVETLVDGCPVIRAELVTALIAAVAEHRAPNLRELQRFSSWIRHHPHH